jgi:hypothetical protein
VLTLHCRRMTDWSSSDTLRHSPDTIIATNVSQVIADYSSHV